LLSIVGCEKWLDVNQNPNDLTISTPELVFNGAAKQFGERQAMGSGFTLMGAWIGYFSHCGGWSGWNNVKSYNMTSSDYTGFWTPYTGDIKNLGYVESAAREDGNNALVAAAKIVKVGTFERIVDTYGDVPYFEAAAGMDGNTTPVYDDAQLIYEDLVVQLDSAILLMNLAIDAFQDMDGDNDPIMGGNKANWIRFANALKLRILLKQSDIPGRDAYITANWTFDPLGFPTRVTMNPGYIAGTSGKMNPLYEDYYKNYQGNDASANTQYGLNVFLKHLYDEGNDPRMMMAWKPGVTSGDYSHGLQLGQNGAPEDHYAGTDGEAIRIDQGMVGGQTDPVQVFSDVELDFLFAEAVARGRTVPGVSGTAQELWEDAIETSFYYYGERAEWDDDDIADTITYYMNRNETNALIGWDAADPVKSIMTQKYIAGVGIYHFQTWTDFRRSGYPEPGDPTLVDYSMISYYFNIVRAQVPVRMLYVQDELDLNGINVNSAISKTGVTYNASFIMDARIFWDVN
jgi:hypothetical protein